MDLKKCSFQKKWRNALHLFVSRQLSHKITTPPSSYKDKLQLMAKGHDIIHREFTGPHFDEDIIKLTDNIILSMVNSVQHDSQINSLLLKIFNSELGFIYQHAHMSFIIASNCIRETPMYEDSKAFYTLAFASFFQNISLAGHEDLAKIFDEKGLNDMELDEDSRKMVTQHALHSYNIVKEFHDRPRGTELLIKHHHGSTEGIGFMQSNIDRFSELDRIFLISSDFVHYFISYKEKNQREGGKLVPIMYALQKRYSTPRGKSTFHLLDKTLLKHNNIKGSS